MRIAAEGLREVGIINEHDLLLVGEPCITYRKRESRSALPNGWHLWIKGHKLDGAWYEHGGLTFTGFGSNEDPLEAAKHAARRILGHPTDWVKSPINFRGGYPTWIPAEAMRRAEGLLRAAKAKA